MKLLFSFSLLFTLCACSSLEQMDKSQINHPAMDISNSRTPALNSFLTTLGSLEDSSGGGACSVCAH